MAVICREKKLLFLLNPRTGSSALGEHLLNEFGGEWLPAKRIEDANGNTLVQHKHNTIQQLVEYNLISHQELKNYIVFVGVANPYSSLLTLYNKYRYRYAEWRAEGRPFLRSDSVANEIEYCSNHTINQWVFSRYWKPALKSIIGLQHYTVNEGYLKGCKEVLRKEYLQSDFELMLSKHAIAGNPTIPRINKTEGKIQDPTLAFNWLSRWLIYITYKSDFDRFGYKR